ncbi:MAG: YafY family transcriptional regulator [Candidatus Thiodiazotropha sp. (ex Cardiolucina cf. quadrata)]|nr:YafY family transcriptional regulator [Candidatus Thiodiazotropha sp. (ex Cardiolucina cf. quadrata)]
MRRADRLFRISQELDTKCYLTARELSRMLEVSQRTIYRDIDALSASGVPIEGTAGAGYRLCEGFRLPPLMFDDEELSALLLGIRIAQAWSDHDLAAAAARVRRKIEGIVPQKLRPVFDGEAMLVPDFHLSETVREHVALLRKAITDKCKVKMGYKRADGTQSNRIVWPLCLFYWGEKWTLGAWCELRGAFRHFRLDRIGEISQTDCHFQTMAGRTLSDFLLAVDAANNA